MDLSLDAVLSWIRDWTSAHPGTTGLVIFATAALESLFLVGVVVPGALFMLSAGALVAFDLLPLWPTLAWAAAGAVVGDGVSFWIGRHFRDRLHRSRRSAALLARGEDFFRRHGGKSVVLGRFVGPIRAVIPTVAGAMGMPPLRFLAVNVLSALAWAPAYILPGVAFGASLELASEVAVRLVIMLLMLVAVLLLTAWSVRRTFRFLAPRADALAQRFLAWSARHRRLGRLGAALVDPRHPESPALLVFAVLLTAAGAGFAVLLGQVLETPAALRLDEPVHDFLQSLRTPWMDGLMVAVTMLGDAWVYLPYALVILAALLLERNRAAAIHWLAAVGLGVVMSRIIKIIVAAPRPTEAYEGFLEFGFPSAHATTAAALFGFLAVLIARELRPRGRLITYTAAGALIVLIAVSRVYLGVHWLSDALGGLTLGLAWAALLGIAYRRHRSPPMHGRRLLAAACGGLLLTGALHLGLHYPEEKQRYALTATDRSMAADGWWTGDWRDLAVYRDDLVAAVPNPLNVQWAGDLRTLEAHLKARGWERPPPLDLRRALFWLSPRAKLTELPVPPQVHEGRHQQLLLRRPGPGPEEQYVLRLWSAHVQLVPDGAPLWIGTVSRQSLRTNLGLISYPVTGDDFDDPLRVLAADLAPLPRRTVHRDAPAAGWSGAVVLAAEPALVPTASAQLQPGEQAQ